MFHRIFKHIDAFPNYLDYYPIGGIERQVKYISEFYSEYEGNPERAYKYLTEAEMDEFVRSKAMLFVEHLRNL